ncbi:MAG: arginyltransferase [Byssovorax sp.]
MAHLIQHIVEAPNPCSYLAEETASLEHRVMLEVTQDELEAMLVRGWRRFGPDYFRPACGACHKCVSTRIVVADFAPTKSQRRARKKLQNLRVMLGPPIVDDERLALYHAWHRDREEARAWAPGGLDRRHYFLQLAFPHPAAREIAYYDDDMDGRLIGVGLCDETPRAWSAIYFFFDPAYAHLSLGVANVVLQVEIAAMRGIPHVYLGYNVAACPSLRYKGAFHPQQMLVGRPDPDEEPRWVPAPRPAETGA